ncbi:hypothetical protein Fcan01_17287, partial [Folsomia candida]
MFCKLMRFFVPFAAGAFVVTTVLKFILLTFSPCTPPFLLSIVEDCGRTEVALGPFVLGILHVFECWMAWHMVTAGGWYTLYIIFAGIESILSYIFILEKILPALLITSPSLQMVMLYVCINHHGDIAMPGFLVFPLLAGEAVIVNILVFTLASFVNSASAKVLADFSGKVKGLREKDVV